jgi:Protein of unknown function (DUF3105)
MARRKKKARRPTSPAAAGGPAAPTSGSKASVPRRERKEAVREQREREMKAAMRRSAVRRALIGGLVGLLVFVAITWYTNRAPGATPLSQAAIDAAAQAGCDGPTRPDPGTPSRDHLASGAPYSYSMQPATSGPHDPEPLPDEPRVYDAEAMTRYTETRAVHSLEHGSVIMYYLPASDTGGLAQGVVDGLAPVADSSRATYLIPYPDLPDGTALAYTAWNQLLTCPSGITPEQAETVATGFIRSFACTKNAPEPTLGPGC